jgi:hypothetical protein
MRRESTKTANYEALKTMAVLAMAAVFFGVISGTKWLLWLSFALLVVGVFIESWSLKVSSVWLKFAHILSAVNTRIILGFVFYVFLTPLGLVYRMTHGDFLGLKREEDKTYFSDRSHTYGARDLANPW